MIVATASVAVIAAATWAGGNGMETPLSPADAPTHQEPSGPPSHGDVATPQRDVSISPGSPVSPGLPGTPSLATPQSRGDGPAPTTGSRNGSPGSEAAGKASDKARSKVDKARAKSKVAKAQHLEQARASRK